MAVNEQMEDLPLMSNVRDILVSHYCFNFKCDFKSKQFTGYSILFLKTVTSKDSCSSETCLHVNTHATLEQNVTCNVIKNNINAIFEDGHLNKSFMLILDCHQINVKEVQAFNYADKSNQFLEFSKFDPTLLGNSFPLEFSVTDWSLKIWKSGENCKHCFPKVIKIEYETVPSCPSVMWVKDQEGNPAVFSYGAAINNRSLFPCQEPPVAMATWEATISVLDPAVVLMSGDEEPHISRSDGLSHYYFYTRKALPLATLSLAIGSWKEHVIFSENKVGPKCRLFACARLLDSCVQELSAYIPLCLKNSEELLSDYPFSRLDFLIVPPTFGSLGMASPNLVFLSQSVLSGDQSLCSRVAHEVAHGWFGLSLGALDWTEEWLSEGFATFVEDIIHVKTAGLSNDEGKEYMELKALIRKKTLMDEIQNTHEELQILRPSFGNESKNIVDGVSATVLKDGQNPMKGFIQVHYVKGYFLLKYLSNIVGTDAFIHFLQSYVKKYESQLVTSKEFLNFFFNSFPFVENTVPVENIYDTWLHNSGSVSEIENLEPSPENKLFNEILEETRKWKKFNRLLLKKRSKKRKWDLDQFKNLTSEQKVLLLENLLDEEEISVRTLKCLDQVYHFIAVNAEVQHRWFELVVKHKYRCKYASLRNFLINHLAMGVYLYGELIYSNDEQQKSIAQDCYLSLASEMEPNYKSTIEKMFLSVTG